MIFLGLCVISTHYLPHTRFPGCIMDIESVGGRIQCCANNHNLMKVTRKLTACKHNTDNVCLQTSANINLSHGLFHCLSKRNRHQASHYFACQRAIFHPFPDYSFLFLEYEQCLNLYILVYLNSFILSESLNWLRSWYKITNSFCWGQYDTKIVSTLWQYNLSTTSLVWISVLLLNVELLPVNPFICSVCCITAYVCHIKDWFVVIKLVSITLSCCDNISKLLTLPWQCGRCPV